MLQEQEQVTCTAMKAVRMSVVAQMSPIDSRHVWFGYWPDRRKCGRSTSQCRYNTTLNHAVKPLQLTSRCFCPVNAIPGGHYPTIEILSLEYEINQKCSRHAASFVWTGLISRPRQTVSSTPRSGDIMYPTHSQMQIAIYSINSAMSPKASAEP